MDGGGSSHRLFTFYDMSKDATKIVSSAILGMDFKTAVVGDKTYIIMPPTIKKLAGAAYWLSDVKDGSSVKEILLSLGDAHKLANALSWFIQGDDALAEELQQGSLGEIVNGLEAAYSLLSVKDFLRLSALARNVASLTAKQR